MEKFLSLKRNADDTNDNNNDNNNDTNEGNKKCRTSSGNITIMTHNCNSLYNRLVDKNGQISYQCYTDVIKEHNVDVLCFQEVRAPAQSNDRTKISTTYGKDKKSKSECQVLNNFLSSDFVKHFSLADQRYSGTLVAIRKGIKVLWVANHFRQAFELDNTVPETAFDMSLVKDNHFEDGRVIIVQFESFTLLATYSPNNGNKDESFVRREKYDNEISKFLTQWKKSPVVWVGDLNIAPETCDTSHPSFFEKENSSLPADHIGLAGTTKLERQRFKSIVNKADIFDAWKFFNPLNELAINYEPEKNNFTWRGSQSGKFYKKSMRLDHIFLSKTLESKLIETVILGHGYDKTGFLGSDHCPLKVVLKID